MAFTVQREQRNHDFASAGRRARSMLEQDKKTLEAEEQRAKEYAKKSAANSDIAKTSGGKSYGAEQTEKKAADAARDDRPWWKQILLPGTADADATFGNYQEARPQDRSRVGNTLNAAGKSTTASNLNALGFLPDEDESGQDAAWDAFGAGSIYNVSTGEWETPKKPEEYELESVKRAKEKASDWAYKKANEFNEEAAESEKLAKDGLGKAGQTLVDIGIAGSQLAGDVALNAALPGSGLAAMGVRSFGSATEKARNEGADMQQQFNYGVTVAAAEVLSEKLFDAAKLFGGGGADDVVERIVSKLSKTDAGRTVTRMLLSGVGEGAEEAVTDLVEPAIRGAFYDKEAMLASYGTPEGRRELAAQAAYDALIGGVLGVAGGGVGILNGENAQKNTALRTQEQLRQAGYTGTVRQKTKADLEREARQADLFAGNLYRPGDTTRQLASAPKTGAETDGAQLLKDYATNKKTEASDSQPRGGKSRQRGVESNASVTTSITDSTGNSNSNLAVEDHIDNRTDEYLAKRSVKSFQYNHPELHEYYEAVARDVLEMVDGSLSTDQYRRGMGTVTHNTPALQSVLEETGLTRAELGRALEAIVNDHGAENYAAAKRTEKALDSLLVNGYYTRGSNHVPPNQAYLNAKGGIVGGTDANSWEYYRDNNLSLALGEITEEEAYNDWRAMHDVVESENSHFRPDGLQHGVGAASRGFAGKDSDLLAERYMDAVDTYGAMPERENLPRQMPVPRSMDGETVVPRTVQSALGAEATSAETVGETTDEIARGGFSRAVITDTSAFARAEQTIRDKDWDTALSDWTAEVRSGKVSKDLATMGLVLYNNAVKSGNAKVAVNILTDLVDHARSGAQATQAMGILNRLTPEGKLYSIQRSVEKLKSDLLKRMGDLAPDVQLDDALVQNYLDAETEDARADALDAIYQSIADQVPSTWRDKLNAWRYLSMLGNPRTHVRNIAGNLFFAPFRGVKNAIGAGIEHAVIGNQKGRTKSLVMPGFLKSEADRARYAAAQNEFGEVVDLIQSGGKFKNEFGEIRDRQQIFKSKVLEWARSKNSEWMDTEDVWFSKQAYAASLTQYLKANGISAEQYNAPGFDKSLARAYAIKEAQKATYRDFNRFSDFVSGLGKTKSTVANTFIEAVLPYKRTPANIFVRGIEYSPIGLAKSLTYDLAQVRRGKLTAAEAIDNIASGLTGTGLTALGVLLANLGVVTGGGSGSDKEDAFSDLTGHQSYALEVGGKSVTLDWLAPEALPFFVGVELQKTLSNGIQSGDDIFTPLKKITEPMLEMSMLSGINDILDSVSDSDNKTWALLSSAATSYIGQYVPTLFGQIERTFENTRQSTYVDKESALPSDMQRAFAKAMNKLPGEYEQIGYIDEWGRTQSTGNLLQRAFNNFVNPAYVSSVNETAVDKELQRLVQQLGDKTVLPETAQKTLTIDGETKALTSGQYTKYATVIGQTRYQLLETAMDSAAYQSMSDRERAEYVSRVYQYAAATAKQNVFPAADVDAWVTNAKNAQRDIGVSTAGYLALLQQYGSKFLSGDAYEKTKSAVQNTGISAEEYIRLRSGYDQNADKSITKAEVVAALDKTGLSREQKRELFSLYNKTWKNPYG